MNRRNIFSEIKKNSKKKLKMKQVYIILFVVLIGISQMNTRVVKIADSKFRNKLLDVLEYRDEMSNDDGKGTTERPFIHVHKKRFFEGYLPKINYYVKQGSDGEIYLVPIDENLNHYFIG